MNRTEARLIARYEATLCAEDVGMQTTPEESAVIQEAVLLAWDGLDDSDRRYLAKYWKAPEVTS